MKSPWHVRGHPLFISGSFLLLLLLLLLILGNYLQGDTELVLLLALLSKEEEKQGKCNKEQTTQTQITLYCAGPDSAL